MYYVLFIRNDFQPDEKYFYFRECDAAYHFRLFADDDSNLYQEIELHHIDNKTNYDFCISKKYFITQK